MSLKFILGSNIAQYGEVSNLVYIAALIISSSMLLEWQNGKIQQKFSKTRKVFSDLLNMLSSAWLHQTKQDENVKSRSYMLGAKSAKISKL